MTPEDRKKIIEAAQAIVDRWDSPAWKYGDPHTGVLIRNLERALALLRAELEKQEPVGKDPVSIAIARNNAGLMEQRGRAITWHGPVSAAQEPKVMTDETIDWIAAKQCPPLGDPWSDESKAIRYEMRANVKAALIYASDHGYLTPLNRSRMGYTATECSEIARKRYADEPRRTFQQQQYAHGLEHGYEHALFEHAGMMDRSRIVEAGDAMRRLLADDRSGNAHGFVMRCANNKEDTFWDVAKEVSVRCKEVVAAWDEAKK